MPARPTQAQLIEALQLSRCTVTLVEALASRALSLSLHNTALAIAKRRAGQTSKPYVDRKRLAAGDVD